MGSFSATGLQPCTLCDRRSFQPSTGRRDCLSCPGTTVTKAQGSKSRLDCVGMWNNKSGCYGMRTLGVVYHAFSEHISNFFVRGAFHLAKNSGLNFRNGGNFQWRVKRHFGEYPEMRTASQSIPKFSKIPLEEFPFYLIMLLTFPNFLVEWFALFHNSQIFRKLSQGISVPLAPVLKVPEFLVE